MYYAKGVPVSVFTKIPDTKTSSQPTSRSLVLIGLLESLQMMRADTCDQLLAANKLKPLQHIHTQPCIGQAHLHAFAAEKEPRSTTVRNNSTLSLVKLIAPPVNKIESS